MSLRKKWLKRFTASLIAAVAAVSYPISVKAATYRDVPGTFYAYAAIDWVSNPANGSIMVGDASGNFNPSRTMDKFEAAKILAVAAGYKYSTINLSPGEQEIFDSSYAMYKPMLDTYSSAYAKWNKTSDREIAYLLYKRVLEPADVALFVTKANNVETVHELLKQDAIMFILRLDGRLENANAISLPYHSPYIDDTLIKADYKKYIYYAKESGIAIGTDNYINPTRAVTRGEVAELLYRVLRNRVSTTTPPPATGTTTVTGVIELVYSNSIVTIVNNLPTIYRVTPTAVIRIDEVQKTVQALESGMTMTAMLNSAGEIVSLSARSSALPPAVTPNYYAEDEGYVTTVSSISGQMLTVKTQRVKLTGEIVAEERAYTLAPGCTIKRGNKDVLFSDIKVNDIVSFKYSGATMYEVRLEEKDRTIFGTLIEKKYIELTGTPVLVVEDSKNVKYELRVTTSTYFMRGRQRNLDWTDLRVGDDIEAQCEYDRLVTVYATGSTSTVNGTIEEIRISNSNKQITVRKTDRTVATYNITSNVVDVSIYDLRVGMGVRLYLDSWEVDDVTITSASNTPVSTTALVGRIEALRSGNTMVIAETDGTNPVTRTIRVDADTLDSTTNKAFDFSKLRVDMYVYVVLTSAGSSTAKSVTILP